MIQHDNDLKVDFSDSPFCFGTLTTLARGCSQLETLSVRIGNAGEITPDTAELPRQLAATLPMLRRLRRVDLTGITLQPELVAALAGLPRLKKVRLSGQEELPPDAAWPHLARLGTRLRYLDLPVFGAQLPWRDGRRHVPDGLLALTRMGQLALNFWGDPGVQQVAGLDALPALRSLQADGGAPREVWTCPGLTRLKISEPRVALPEPGHWQPGQLSPLRDLWLDNCFQDEEQGFPEVLCHQSSLTRLHVEWCTLRPQAALPPQFSQLR